MLPPSYIFIILILFMSKFYLKNWTKKSIGQIKYLVKKKINNLYEKFDIRDIFVKQIGFSKKYLYWIFLQR